MSHILYRYVVRHVIQHRIGMMYLAYLDSCRPLDYFVRNAAVLRRCENHHRRRLPYSYNGMTNDDLTSERDYLISIVPSARIWCHCWTCDGFYCFCDWYPFGYSTMEKCPCRRRRRQYRLVFFVIVIGPVRQMRGVHSRHVAWRTYHSPTQSS